VSLPPNTNKFLDIVQNSQPIAAKQAVAIISAIILAVADQNLHWTTWDTTGLFTPLVAYAVVNFVGDIWARAQVWSAKSHAAAVEAAKVQA